MQGGPEIFLLFGIDRQGSLYTLPSLFQGTAWRRDQSDLISTKLRPMGRWMSKYFLSDPFQHTHILALIVNRDPIESPGWLSIPGHVI